MLATAFVAGQRRRSGGDCGLLHCVIDQMNGELVIRMANMHTSEASRSFAGLKPDCGQEDAIAPSWRAPERVICRKSPVGSDSRRLQCEVLRGRRWVGEATMSTRGSRPNRPQTALLMPKESGTVFMWRRRDCSGGEGRRLLKRGISSWHDRLRRHFSQ